MEGDINWAALSGMSEAKAEQYMLDNWGYIPQEWFDPLYRDQVTGYTGQAELDAHMNDGELKYGGESRHGDQARGIWHDRNFKGQGHPAEQMWTMRNKRK